MSAPTLETHFVEYKFPTKLTTCILKAVGVEIETNPTTIIGDDYEGPSINTLLDRYQEPAENGRIPVFRPSSPEAREIITALKQGPRLSRPLFSKGEMPRGEQSLAIASRDKLTVPLPTNSFVWAPKMRNWVDGRAYPKYNGERTIESRELIRNYSKRQTMAPAIGSVLAHVQPDNLVTYSVVADGAHRTAAAMRRGDEYIRVGGTVIFERLPENVIDIN